ncbi:hypothetical protein MKW98_003331, partial [Papaver atlanticum]
VIFEIWKHRSDNQIFHLVMNCLVIIPVRMKEVVKTDLPNCKLVLKEQPLGGHQFNLPTSYQVAAMTKMQSKHFQNCSFHCLKIQMWGCPNHYGSSTIGETKDFVGLSNVWGRGLGRSIVLCLIVVIVVMAEGSLGGVMFGDLSLLCHEFMQIVESLCFQNDPRMLGMLPPKSRDMGLLPGAKQEIPLPPDASNTLFVEGVACRLYTTRSLSYPFYQQTLSSFAGPSLGFADIFRPFVGFKEVRLVSKESRHVS